MTSRIITISTVAPTSIERGYVPIIARTRAAKGKAIAPNNRLRAICITEPDVSDLPSRWAMFASAQLGRIAVAQLQELWANEGDNLRETHAGLWTTDALLAFAARDAESKRLSGESITAAMSEFLATVNPAAKETASAILASMAAPVKKGNEKQLFNLHEKLVSFLTALEDNPDATEEPNPILSTVAHKMLERANELKSQRLAFETDAAAF